MDSACATITRLTPAKVKEPQVTACQVEERRIGDLANGNGERGRGVNEIAYEEEREREKGAGLDLRKKILWFGSFPPPSLLL